ncbi:MAG: DUF2206 domain-containing protein [archaeon]
MISISLLLMGWLRSWYVSGVDINQEYQIFQLIKENGYWSMSLFHHAYNACLSVSILPVILSNFLKINDQYIFKLIIPLIFSFVPVIIYFISKKFVKNYFAFLASLFFVSQPTFLIWWWIPIRQEVAFLFFALAILILFDEKISLTIKRILFIIFGFSMIVSHYSTTYIALGIFIITYIIVYFFRKTNKTKIFSKIYKKINLSDTIKSKKSYYINGLSLILIIIFALFWNFQVTESSSNVVYFVENSFKNMRDIFSQEVQAEGQSLFDQFNIFYKQKSVLNVLREYSDSITKVYLNKYSNSDFYSQNTYSNYNIRQKISPGIPYKFDTKTILIIYSIREFIKVLGKILVIVGIVYMVFQMRNKNRDIEYLTLKIAGFIALSIIIILPFSSISYDLVRTYQQTLILLSLPAILGGWILFKFFRKNYRIIILTIFLLIYFLFLSRFIQQGVGGPDITMGLNNEGIEYDVYYVHKTEVISGNWLFNNYDKNNLIYLDKRAISKVELSTPPKFTTKIAQDVLPSIIKESDYVYLSYANVFDGIAFKTIKGNTLSYNYPTEFLNQNKNLIYNNGGSEIFK